jgi:PAS domain-containing protein
VSDESQHDVELILMTQVASYLATPIFVVDPNGDLVYFNEPAEQLLGRGPSLGVEKHILLAR